MANLSQVKMSEPNGLKPIFWKVGIILLIIGMAGWLDRLFFGHLHANYGSIVTWGLWIAVYIYFIGLSAGAFLISSLVYVFNLKQFEKIGRVALFTAVVTLLLGLLSVAADLGHMSRAWHVLIFPNFKSPMAWMIWLYSAYFTLLCGELWFLLRADFVRLRSADGFRGRLYDFLTFGSRDTTVASIERDRKRVKTLATIGVPLAIMFHGGVGALFGIVAARPHWHSGLFPILFLLSALVSGGALLIVIAAVFQDGWNKNKETVLLLGKMVLGLLLLDVLFQLSEILVAFRGGIPGHAEGIELEMFGPYWWVFWGIQVLLGTVIPIWLLVSQNTRMNPKMVTTAGLLIAIGFIGLRLNIVIPGLAAEEVNGISHALSSSRLSADYFPSLTEFLLTAGVIGLGLVLFGLGEKYLPIENERV
jgi:molybdopterin-containing oxidoreductase family membrane subunit